MPPVRSITTAADRLTIVLNDGVERTILASQIPATQNTVAKVETYLNNIWRPTFLAGRCVMEVHVFSLNPLRVNVWTSNTGLTPPANWWVK